MPWAEPIRKRPIAEKVTRLAAEAPKPESNGHDYSQESFVIEQMHSTLSL